MKLAVLRNYKNVGKLHGEGDAFASGHVAHVEFSTVKQLGKVLRDVAGKPRLCVCIGNFPKDGEVVPRDKIENSSQMARTKETVNSGNILVIDNDSGDDFDVNIFAKYWDAFDGAGYIRTRSGSTLLGKKKNGSHTYFVVRGNTVQLQKAFSLMEAICIIEGLGKVEFYKTGKAVLKTPIDMSLSQPSRLVYEDDVEPEIVDGELITISRFPNNFKELMEQAERVKTKTLDSVKDEEVKLHREYMLKFNKTKFETHSEAEHSLRNFNTYEINEDFPLHVNGKYVGDIRDLLLGHLEEKLFSDLYEPDYDNGSQKARYYPDTRTFFSQAHGGIKYTIVVTDEFNNEMLADFLKEAPHLQDVAMMSDEMSEIMRTTNDIERGRLIKNLAGFHGVTPTIINREIKRLTPLVAEFDKFYELWVQGKYDEVVNPHNRLKNYHQYEKESHFVNNGSKNIIIRHHKNDNGGTSITMNSVPVESEIYADRKTTIMSFDDDTKITTFRDVDTVDLFVNGSNDDASGIIKPARRYTGVEFAPKRKLHVAYNLFQGFDIKPVKGDISKWEAVMSASFGKHHYEFIMDWFADMYQNPDRKVMFAVVVKGEKGTGKNTFEEVLGRSLLPNQYYMRTANKDQLFGKFNKQLASNLLTVGQEIVWGGDHNHDSVLKDMITERSRTIEIKGQDSFTVANFSRMYITSNADWVIPATKDERRFYVASTTGTVTKARWKRFWNWLEKAETKEALMYEMMNRDLSNYSNIVCPETEELLEQQRETLYGIEKFVVEGMEDGFFGSNDKDVYSIKCEPNMFISTSDLYEQFKRSEPRSKMSRDKFSKTLSRLGFKPSRKNNDRGYIVPTELTL